MEKYGFSPAWLITQWISEGPKCFSFLHKKEWKTNIWLRSGKEASGTTKLYWQSMFKSGWLIEAQSTMGIQRRKIVLLFWCSTNHFMKRDTKWKIYNVWMGINKKVTSLSLSPYLDESATLAFIAVFHETLAHHLLSTTFIIHLLVKSLIVQGSCFHDLDSLSHKSQLVQISISRLTFLLNFLGTSNCSIELHLDVNRYTSNL